MTKANQPEQTEAEKHPVDQTESAESPSNTPAGVKENPVEAELPPANLEDELEAARKESAEHYNRYLRTVADLENFRKRAVREKEEIRQFAVSKLVEDLLPVVENLSLGLVSARQASDAKSVVDGVGMVLDQLKSVLGNVGLKEINPAAGDAFDPHQHESISHLPSDDVPAEMILQIVRVGYSLNGRLLRPAVVVLSGGPKEE